MKKKLDINNLTKKISNGNFFEVYLTVLEKEKKIEKREKTLTFYSIST